MAVRKEIRRFHGIFHKMIFRCIDPKSKDYPRYGGRGIRSQWSGADYKDFERKMYRSYKRHAEKYGEKNTTLDRIDTNGHYEVSNLRWATWIEQANNRRSSKFILWRGKSLSLSEWSRHLGIARNVLNTRLLAGWTLDKAFSHPVEPRDHPLTFLGKTKNIGEWAKILKLNPSTVSARLQRGLTDERVLARPIKKMLKICGKKLSVPETAKLLNKDPSTVYRYIRRNRLKELLSKKK